MVTVMRLLCGMTRNIVLLSINETFHSLFRYVHHLSEDMKEVLRDANIPVPLLSPARHALCEESLDEVGHKICGAYKEQVTCASCHSNELPPSSRH